MKTTSLKRMLCVLFAIAAVLSMALPAMAAGSGLSDVKYFLKQGTTVFVEGQTYVNEMNQPEGAYKIKDNMFSAPARGYQFVCWSRIGTGRIYGNIDRSAIPNYSTKLDYYAPGYVVRLNQSYTFYGIWSCKRDVIYYANIPGESNYNPGNYLMESAWYGTVKEVGANPFTYAGHEFVCWARSGSGRIYGNIDPSAIPGYSTTLDYYAPGCELVMNQAYTFWAVWADLAPAADVTP